MSGSATAPVGRPKALANRREVLLKIVPVIGSVILFLSWTFQQTLLEESNSGLQKIANAQSVFQTYQSNNALFNALIETTGNSDRSNEQIRRLQIYNYELGLRDMEALLDNQQRADLDKAPNPFGGQTPESMLPTTQRRLDQIQTRVSQKRDMIVDQKAERNRQFLALYAFGSLVLLLGAVANALVSLPQKPATYAERDTR